MHLLRQPVHLPPRVTENDSLSNRHRLVKIAERVQFPFFFLHRNVELLDTFERQLVPLHEDAHGVTHKLFGHLQDIRRHRGRQQHHLRVLWQELEQLVDLVLETTGQHLICLVETEHLDMVRPERSPVDHVVHASRRAHDDLNTLLQLSHVFAYVGTTNASVALNVHVVTQCDHDFLDLLREFASGCEDESLAALGGQVDLLENGDGEGGGLASTGLGLGDDIVSLYNRHDRALLDGRRTLET